MDTIQERTERRYRRGGLFFMLVGALAAVYALGLHNGSGEPPAYGLALEYVLDWSGRLADRVGGVLGKGWESRAYQVNLGVAAAFTALGFVAWLGSRVHKVFSIFGFVPRVVSRLLYLVAFAVYAADTVVAVAIEIGMRKMFQVQNFAMPCIVLHGLILVMLAYGLSNGMYILVEAFQVLKNPGRALRATRTRRAEGADQTGSAAEE